jgi:CHAT domain-containing protein/lipopolysaccharide biosynthesis regulator YciM
MGSFGQRAFVVFVLSYSQSLLVAADPLPLTAADQAVLDKTKQDADTVEKLHITGKFSEAEKLSAQILATRTKLLGDNHLDTASACNLHGLSHEWLGNIQQSAELFGRAIAISERLKPGDDANRAEMYRNLAGSYMNLGELKKSREAHLKSLAMAQRVFGAEHKKTALAHMYYSVLLRAEGNYAEALKQNDIALQMLEKLVGREDVETLNAYYSRALIVDHQGDLAGSIKLYDEVYQLRKKVLGADHPETLTVLSSVAEKQQALRHYPEARRLYEEVLSGHLKSLGPDHYSVAEDHFSIGVVLESQGDYAAAKRQYEEALRIRKKSLGEEHSTVAYTLHSLGCLQMAQAEYAEAEERFRYALQLQEKIYGPGHVYTTGTLSSLGDLFVAQRQYAKARPFYEQVLTSRLKYVGEKHVDTAAAYRSLGDLLRMRGNYTGARPYLQKTHEVRRAALGDKHLDTAYALDDLAILEGNLGNFSVAATHEDAALRTILNHAVSVLPSLSDREQLAFLNYSLTAVFHRGMTLGLMRPENANISALSAEWSLNGKGTTQNALAERILLLRDLESAQPGDVASKLLDTRRRLATLTLSIPEKDQAEALAAQIKELTTQEEELSRKISQTSKTPNASRSWIELNTLRAAIPPGSALIDITRLDVYNFQAKGKEKIWLESRYVAWIIPPPGKDQIQIVDLGLCEEINEAITLVSDTMTATAKQDSLLRSLGEGAAVKQFDTDFSAVSDMILPSLEPRLPAGTKNLILSPDGMLWLLPWAALPVDGDKYLLEKYSLRFITSSRDLLPKPAVAKTLTTSAPIIFADPDFDLTADGTSAAIKKIYPEVAVDNALRGITSQSALPSVGRLPNTEIEAEAIKANVEKIAKTAPQLYLDRFALEAVVKRVARPKILVLSTHGFFLPDQVATPVDENAVAEKPAYVLDGTRVENPLLRCGLLLAGCNTRQNATGEDGILTGMEIVGLDLRGTEMVVLSACETGLGKVNNGEGVAGLRQAFQLAGANSVISTLWQVPDRDTAILMNDFFANLASGQSKPDALRNAQLKRIQTRRERFGGAHPLYWAAWTLTGN